MIIAWSEEKRGGGGWFGRVDSLNHIFLPKSLRLGLEGMMLSIMKLIFIIGAELHRYQFVVLKTILNYL